jgi:hypothetical protein
LPSNGKKSAWHDAGQGWEACEDRLKLKNQWGWGGYSTQDIDRCNLAARAVALIYKGDVGMCGLPIPMADSKRLLAARYCWQL